MAGVYLVLGFAEYIAGPAMLVDLYNFHLLIKSFLPPSSISMAIQSWKKKHLESKL